MAESKDQCLDLALRMADAEFDNLFDVNFLPWGYNDQEIYQAFDGESSTAVSLQSYAHSSDDIEYIYTNLHRSVDQVVAQISVCTPPRLDQIREQNRGLIQKLTTLESAITTDTTAVEHITLGSESPDTDPSASSASGVARRSSGSKRRRVSQPSRTRSPRITDPSSPDTPIVSTIRGLRICQLALLRRIYS